MPGHEYRAPNRRLCFCTVYIYHALADLRSYGAVIVWAFGADGFMVVAYVTVFIAIWEIWFK